MELIIFTNAPWIHYVISYFKSVYVLASSGPRGISRFQLFSSFCFWEHHLGKDVPGIGLLSYYLVGPGWSGCLSSIFYFWLVLNGSVGEGAATVRGFIRRTERLIRCTFSDRGSSLPSVMDRVATMVSGLMLFVVFSSCTHAQHRIVTKRSVGVKLAQTTLTTNHRQQNNLKCCCALFKRLVDF